MRKLDADQEQTKITEYRGVGGSSGYIDHSWRQNGVDIAYQGQGAEAEKARLERLEAARSRWNQKKYMSRESRYAFNEDCELILRKAWQKLEIQMAGERLQLKDGLHLMAKERDIMLRRQAKLREMTAKMTAGCEAPMAVYCSGSDITKLEDRNTATDRGDDHGIEGYNKQISKCLSRWTVQTEEFHNAIEEIEHNEPMKENADPQKDEEVGCWAFLSMLFRCFRKKKSRP